MKVKVMRFSTDEAMRAMWGIELHELDAPLPWSELNERVAKYTSPTERVPRTGSGVILHAYDITFLVK
jgi:hypothetical protein